MSSKYVTSCYSYTLCIVQSPRECVKGKLWLSCPDYFRSTHQVWYYRWRGPPSISKSCVKSIVTLHTHMHVCTHAHTHTWWQWRVASCLNTFLGRLTSSYQLLGTLVAVFVAQSSASIWAEMSTKNVLRLLLTYSMHPKPKVGLRRAAETDAENCVL